jgi:5-methylcytosine-specific restriction endonuclease McrA
MARREFPTKVRVAVIKRATKEGVIFCERCGSLAKKFQIDHIIADALGGEPVLENAMLICEPCFQEKNPKDTTLAAKVKRVEARHLGAVPPPRQKLQSRGFARKQRTPKPSLPPRALFRDA